MPYGACLLDARVERPVRRQLGAAVSASPNCVSANWACGSLAIRFLRASSMPNSATSISKRIIARMKASSFANAASSIFTFSRLQRLALKSATIASVTTKPRADRFRFLFAALIRVSPSAVNWSAKLANTCRALEQRPNRVGLKPSHRTRPMNLSGSMPPPP